MELLLSNAPIGFDSEKKNVILPREVPSGHRTLKVAAGANSSYALTGKHTVGEVIAFSWKFSYPECIFQTGCVIRLLHHTIFDSER